MAIRIGGTSIDIETRDPAAEGMELPPPYIPRRQDPPPPFSEPLSRTQSVTITGIDVPFGDLMWLIVKLVVAAIPAAILLTAIAFVLVGSGFFALGSLFR